MRAASGIHVNEYAITVDHAAGQFVIGVGGARPTYVTIADFTDSTFPNGFANYYVGTSGVMGDKSPLVGANARTYTFAWTGQH